MLAPATNRGGTIGVLELFLTQITPDALEQVDEAAHALAYILVTDRRFRSLTSWPMTSVMDWWRVSMSRL